MPGRTTPIQTAADLTSAGTKPYHYGFNGKESDFEVKNSGGSSYDFGARMYDPRLGRWLSTDNIYKAPLSPYQFGKNSPTIYIDPDGNDEFYFNLVSKNWTYKPAPGENRYYVSMYSMVDHKVQEIHRELNPGNPSVGGSRGGSMGITKTSLGLLGAFADNDLTSLAKFCIQNPTILPLLESSENPKDQAIYEHIKTYAAFNKIEEDIKFAADIILLADGAINLTNILAKSSKVNISLGLKRVDGNNKALFEFSLRMGSAEHEQWAALGYHDANAPSFEAAFNQVTSKVVRTNGKIDFNITGLDLGKAGSSKGKSIYDVGYTDWEINQVVGNKELLTRTTFYENGAVVPTEKVLERLGAN